MRLLPRKGDGGGCIIAFLLIALFLLIGWIQSICKAVNSNWEPIGKREIIYTVGSFIPPFGGIVGWSNIQDK